ncbi:MAG: hypothetical protein GY715_01785, partial [Planctomycetes bacterium]|nr:hypothetical protein [Planctomycetota bacterium]
MSRAGTGRRGWLKRVLIVIGNAIGVLLCAIAVVGVSAWLVGRVVSDRYDWSQWLLWIPTPAALAIVLIGLLGALRPGWSRRRRRGRVWRWGIAVLALAAHFALVEHRMLRGARKDPAGLRLVHWSVSDAWGSPNRYAPSVVALDGELTILSNATLTPSHPDVLGWLGPPHVPHKLGPFTVLTRLPIRQLRWLIASADDIAVGLLEIEPTVHLPRGLVIYMIDLPSRPRLGRAAIARRVRGFLDEADGPPPDLVVGDLNMTRGSAALDSMLPGLRHAFDVGGHGYGASFHGRFPLYHIDHVLLAGTVDCTRYDL